MDYINVDPTTPHHDVPKLFAFASPSPIHTHIHTPVGQKAQRHFNYQFLPTEPQLPKNYTD